MSEEKMEGYTEYKAKCAKCGAGLAHESVIKSEYVEVYITVAGIEEPDYIKRTCWRCGYIWREAPLDRDDRPPPTPTPTSGEDTY